MVKKGSTPNTELKEESECREPWERSYFWPRIIRPNMKKHKHSIMDLCAPSGLLERRIIAKSHGVEGGYKKVKKMRWGDLWYFEKMIPHKFRKEGKFGKRLW